MKKFAVLLALALAIALFAACGKKPQVLTFSFDSNPTTGYSWTYAMEGDDILAPVTDEYVAPATSAAGAGGTQNYGFEVTGDGAATLSFTYARPWESVPAASVRTYTFTVADGKATQTACRETVSLCLPANSGSTGYTWRFTADSPGILTEEAQQYIAPADGKLGGIGTQIFTLTSGHDGTVTLRFTYGPAWEDKDTGIWANYTYTVSEGLVEQNSAELQLGVLANS